MADNVQNEVDMVDGGDHPTLLVRQVKAKANDKSDNLFIYVISFVMTVVFLLTYINCYSNSADEVTAEKSLIKDMYELLLQLLIDKRNTTELMPNFRNITTLNVMKSNFPVTFKRELVMLLLQHTVLKYKPHIISGFKSSSSIAVHFNGQIVVSEEDEHRVSVKTKSIKRSLNHSFKYPADVAISSDGYILVTDKHRLHKLSFNGKLLQSVGGTKANNGKQQFNLPDGIAVHPHTGQVYIADHGNYRIQVLNSDLSYNNSFGMKGSIIGRFNYPRDLAFDSEGNLYVVDFHNSRVQKFTSQGYFITSFGQNGLFSSRLFLPVKITIDSYDLVYVKDGTSRISIFDVLGNFIYAIEGIFGTGGIAIYNNTLYICGSLKHNVIKF